MSPAALRTRGAAALLAALAAALLLAATLAAPARAADQRIVALTPFTANTLSLLGVRPVAVGETLGGRDKFVRGLNGVERLTLSHPLGPNIEELALLNPSIVLSAPVWTKGSQSMRELGMRVVESDPQRVADVPRQTEFIGQVIGKRAAAKKLADTQRKRIKIAQRRIKRRPSVLLVLGLGANVQAFMPDSWGGDLVTQAGGRLLTKGLPSLSRGFGRISDEIIVERDPDIIIAVPHGTPSNIPRLAAELRSRPAWKNTKAARSNRIYISTDNTLLQAWTSAAQSIADVQKKYLKNAGR